tara:strand:- start:3882 stop:4307 length:426 start_codon:yes stop_codon:yes gene_type:complete
MTMKKKIINKGYTVEVVSWENDGDNYRTKSTTYSSLEEAKAVKRMCENLFISGHDDNTVGNKVEDQYEECCEIVKSYLVSHPESQSGHFKVKEDTRAGDAWDSISHVNSDLLGSSEYYFSRVCESCTIYFSPQDVYLEVIE